MLTAVLWFTLLKEELTGTKNLLQAAGVYNAYVFHILLVYRSHISVD